MRATINGFEMAFDDVGSGPAVVLVHGFPLCRQMWQPQAEALVAAGYRVITPDLRGFGESAPAGDCCTMADFADDIAALLEHLKIAQAVVGGMSMGGYVLLSLLQRHPQKVRAAAFIVTRADADDAAGKARRTALIEEVRNGRASVVPEAFAGLVFAPATKESKPELVRKVRDWMEVTSPQGMMAALAAIRDRESFIDRLSCMTQPAWVVGAEEDQAIPPAKSVEIAERWPQSHLLLIGGGGHMVNLEQPAEFNKGMLAFLQTLPI